MTEKEGITRIETKRASVQQRQVCAEEQEERWVRIKKVRSSQFLQRLCLEVYVGFRRVLAVCGISLLDLVTVHAHAGRNWSFGAEQFARSKQQIDLAD